MFKNLVLLYIVAGFAISLAACGKSDEDKCKEMIMSQFPDGKLPPVLTQQGFDQAVKACAAGAKLMK